ncbi:MAG: Six-hairpin glycosidase-like protein [Gammaproteobacteria bacterium]|nr:Six-hairpin glycosidase-like protein [Gammaproteobacteria bacterium]
MALSGLALFGLTMLSFAVSADSEGSIQQRQYAHQFGKVSLEALQLTNGQREFKLQTNSKQKTIQVDPTQLQVSSNNALFDALFSLTQQEREQDSVSEITDWGFNDQQPVPCPCFETGAKWHYVWTRDLSYSLDLGLGYLDPERATNSLLFKTSKVRPELIARGVDATEVALQDTGSGGSWPVSSDRVVWVLAASNLTAKAADEGSSLEAQQAWLAKWYPIAKQTLLQDRQYIFSNKLGLYRGETSFLDWREQTYPGWTAKDTLYLAESYALSTNVLHYVALERTAAAARLLEPAMAAQFSQWASALKTSINQSFWLADQGLYASYIGEEYNPVPVQQYDLLGLSLAITHQVASSAQAQQILANYPITPAGPPVIFPARQQIPIYHNRAIWPFVSSYALRAAKQQQHAELFHLIAMSLFQGTAFNLSNMENLEWLTQQAHVEDGELSGPVINSERQLWSVAAYHDFVVRSLFGIEVEARQITINPFIPAQTQQALQLGKELRLQQLPIAAGRLNVTLKLQGSASRAQSYRLQKATLNGVETAIGKPYQLTLNVDDLSGEQNELELELTAVELPKQKLQLLKAADPAKLTVQEQHTLFAPKEPLLSLSHNKKQQTELSFDANGEQKTQFTLYKNGSKVALKKGKTSFTDKDNGGLSQCYALVQSYSDNGLTSLPSKTLCTTPNQQVFIAGQGLQSADLETGKHLGLAVYKNWGLPEQQLQLNFSANKTGPHRLQLLYFIDNGPINTGITAVVKTAAIQCGDSKLQQGTLVMPHLATATEQGLSSQIEFQATAGQSCAITIKDGFNMSYLQHFELYTGGKGGRSGPLNQAVIHAASIVPADSD